MKFHSLLLLLLGVVELKTSPSACDNDEQCDRLWPEASCRNRKCICPLDSIRRKSESYGWVCLSLTDKSTGMLGPPFTCPLPDGAGYRSVLYNDGPVFCDTVIPESCPDGYECIQSIGARNRQGNGVCCPDRKTTCKQEGSHNADGWIQRWYFDGRSCKQFDWNPEKKSTANNFATEAHCQSYCIYDV